MVDRVSIRTAIWIATLGSAAMGSSAQIAPPLINPVGASAAAADPSVNPVLDQLQQRGQHLHAFVGDVMLTETDTTMGTTTARNGRVWYQLLPDGQARLRIVFDTKSLNDKPAQTDRKEYLLDGPWLVDRDYTAKIEARRQIARPGEKVNLFQLGKGPFPLPIGQDKQQVLALFDVKKMPADPSDPANTDHLQLTPKPATDFARKIHTLDVWVDRTTSMPVRIETLDAQQSTDRQTDLKNVRINPSPDVSDRDFALPPLGPGWNQHDEPLQ